MKMSLAAVPKKVENKGVTKENKGFTLNVKKLKENAILPTKGSKRSAGYDLYAVNDCVINPGESEFIGTGISVELINSGNKLYGLFIYARSGLACKQGLAPANCVGVVDDDYRGEVIVCLRNFSNEVREIKAGDRIAQLVVQEVGRPNVKEASELSDTARSSGGFGSTGR